MSFMLDLIYFVVVILHVLVLVVACRGAARVCPSEGYVKNDRGTPPSAVDCVSEAAENSNTLRRCCSN
jgi:hypothetical protein